MGSQCRGQWGSRVGSAGVHRKGSGLWGPRGAGHGMQGSAGVRSEGVGAARCRNWEVLGI